MKTLILSSSLSKNSRSFILCCEVSKQLTNKGVRCNIIDARNIPMQPTHNKSTTEMKRLASQIEETDNIIIGMGIHCYSINDSLKILLDTCFSKATGKFYGILCAAGGEKSYLATMQLSQICMNEWRMIQLPRVVYTSGKDWADGELVSADVSERVDVFVNEFIEFVS